jgi:hypothetical protein
MTEQPRDPAAVRFAILQLVRLSGAVLVLLGVLIVSGRLPMLAVVPEAGGYAIMVAGLVEFFVIPTLLAKSWRSDRP